MQQMNPNDQTITFSIKDERELEIHSILSTVYNALVEKGGTKNALWITLLVITAVTMFVLTIVYTAIMVSALI